jgi:nucleotide-binding universal stress UspA family protein
MKSEGFAMQPIHKVMVACDFSEHAIKVLGYAARLAAALKAQILLVNVINQRDVDAVKSAFFQKALTNEESSVETILIRQRQERATLMQELIEEAGCGHLPIKKIFRSGIPFEEISRVAAEETADLVVIGSRGRGTLTEAFFGTTAEKIFRHSPVPVLVVRVTEAAA